MEDLNTSARTAVVEFVTANKAVEEAAKALAEAKSRARKASIEASKVVNKGKTTFAFKTSSGDYRHFSATRGGSFALKKFLPSWTLEGRVVVDISDVI